MTRLRAWLADRADDIGWWIQCRCARNRPPIRPIPTADLRHHHLKEKP